MRNSRDTHSRLLVTGALFLAAPLVWIAVSAPAALLEAQPEPTSTPDPPRIEWPTPSATPPDTSTDAAIEVLQRSDEAMNELRSMRLHWEVQAREGSRPLPFENSDERFAAPDRMARVVRYDDHPPIESIWIGGDRWSRSGEKPWEHDELREPFDWPSFEHLFLEGDRRGGPVRNVVVEDEELIEGEDAWVISYEHRARSFEGPFDVFSKEWIHRNSYRMVRAEYYNTDPWGSSGVEIYRFYDFDSPVTIEPPIDRTPSTERLLLPWLTGGRATH